MFCNPMIFQCIINTDFVDLIMRYTFLPKSVTRK